MLATDVHPVFEYDPVLESGFSHVYNQSSVKKLVETGKGDCYAYAKYRLLAEPWLGLFVRYDNNSGIHFGSVDFIDNGITLHHLISSVKSSQLTVDNDLFELASGGKTLVTATQKQNGYYGLNDENESIKALFFNTFDWKNVFHHIHKSFDDRNPWKSIMHTLIKLDD